MNKTYKINEIFYSLQGEGLHSGTPAVFIRFSGCNLKCPFCDTTHETGEQLTLTQISERIDKVIGNARPVLAVITGGEPSLFIDKEFIYMLHQRGFRVAVETNGTTPLPRSVDFITCSPKFEYVKNSAVKLTNMDEIKVVYDMNNDMDLYTGFIRLKRCKYAYLQPCDTGDEERNKEIIQAAVKYCLEHPVWHLSLQTQKILNVR